MSFADHLEAVGRFTDEVLIPTEPDMVRQGRVPEPVVRQMAELGLFGLSVPRAYGGLGWTMEQQVRLTLEFTRASCVYRSRFSTTIGLTAQVLLEHGTETQRRTLLPPLAAGEWTAAFALTEEGAGSDASSIRTRAVPCGDGYTITGRKRYITNGATADVLMVFAQVEGAGPTTFLVDAHAPGVERRPADRMNGHAENPVAHITFDGVRVAGDRIVGAPGDGLTLALRGINHARTHVAATAVGQGTRFLEEMTAHAMRRVQFGSRLADLGSVEAMLGTSYADMSAARALTLACARDWDQQRVVHQQISAAKYFATEAVGRVADRAVQILGGEGIVGDHPVPRMWRDVRALRIYEGASEVHERNMARYLKSLADSGGPIWPGQPQ